MAIVTLHTLSRHTYILISYGKLLLLPILPVGVNVICKQIMNHASRQQERFHRGLTGT